MLKKITYIFDARQKRNLIFLFVIIFVGSIIETIGISIIAPLISLCSNESVLYNNSFFIKISRIFHIASSADMAIFLALTIIVIYVAKNAYLCMQYDFLYRFIYNNQHKLSVRMINCYLKQDYLYYLSNNVAELQRNITQDTTQFYSYVLAVVRLSSEFLISIFLVLYLLICEYMVTILVVVIILGLMGPFIYFYRKKIFSLGVSYRNKSAEQNKWILQSFGGVKEIKTYGRELFFINKYSNSNNVFSKSVCKYSFLGAIQKPIIEAGCICGLMVVVAIQIYLGIPLSSLVTTLSIFAAAAFRMLPAFNRISENYNQIMFYKASVDTLYYDLMEIYALENRNLIKRKNIEYFDRINSISGKNISFVYPSGDKCIIHNVTFEIKANQSVAIIGESGVGKTTLADIILGHLKPSEGEITVNGISIYENLEGWRSIIGYIPQTIYLMDDSIRNNVAFGICEKEIDDDRIWEVLEEAQLANFVHTLPGELDTFVGDRGVRLSGGQRQRIGIARALYSNPSFIIFDEATSSLDTDTEEAVMDAINKMHGSRTMLIIAHRLSTIKNCDVIYKIDKEGMNIINKDKLITD